MDAHDQKLFDRALEVANIWGDKFNPDGNPDVDKIQEILSARTFEGKQVEAYTARDPDDALDFLKNWAKKAVAGGEDKAEIEAAMKNVNSCIWDYYLMAFYESACSVLENKDFEGAEFIYQSLRPAFEAGLGYLINLGPLIVGVCLPEAHFDDQRRIHRATGPAIVWGDDREYWWHGVKVEEQWIEHPETVDPATCINHENIEARRALCEIIGWDKIIDSLNPDVLDVDDDPQIGTLLQADIPDHGQQKFLRVLEESTGRQFVILAPDEANTALDAQALINQIPADLFSRGYIRS